MQADLLEVTSPYIVYGGGLTEVFVLIVDGNTQEAVELLAFTGLGNDVGTAIAADPAGGAVIAVSYEQNLDVDAAAGISFNSGYFNFDAGLVKIDSTATVLWGNAYGGPASDEITGLGVDSTSRIFIAGLFTDMASFGGPQLIGTEDFDLVVAGYAENGNHLWSEAFTGGSYDVPLDVEVTDDAVYVSGWFKEDLTAGIHTLQALSAEYDIFVGRFNTANGTPQWLLSVGSDQEDQGSGLGLGGDGSIYVGGHVKGEVSFAGAAHPLQGSGLDGFVFRLTQ